MRVLLVNQPWPVFGGSETYLLTIAAELERLGHDVELYGPAAAPATGLARERGLQMRCEPHELPSETQVVLTQDAESCAKMATRYPEAVRVYVAHSGPFLPQRPPQVPGAYHAIVTMNEGVRRMASALAFPGKVVRLRQPVDLDRFSERGEPAAKLRRVLLLGNHWVPGTRNHNVVAEACAQLGLELRHVGSGGRVSQAPEVEIAAVDAVVGIGRCVVETMAMARAAYLFGNFGVSGWLTPHNYSEIEKRGFTGTATDVTIDAARLADDLRHYEAEMGHQNRRLAIAHHSSRRHAAELVELISELEPSPVADPTSLDTVARMARVQWEVSTRVGLAEGESALLRDDNRRLIEESERLTGEIERLASDYAALERHLAAVVTGRRYRIAQRLGRPVEAIRAMIARIRPGREGQRALD